MQSGIGLGDPGQLGVLVFGEVFGVLPQRIAGALELADPLMARPRRGVLAGAAAAPFALARASTRASFQARRRSSSSALVAQPTTWKGLCRYRHNPFYVDVRIMPMSGGSRLVRALTTPVRSA